MATIKDVKLAYIDTYKDEIPPSLQDLAETMGLGDQWTGIYSRWAQEGWDQIRLQKRQRYLETIKKEAEKVAQELAKVAGDVANNILTDRLGTSKLADQAIKRLWDSWDMLTATQQLKLAEIMVNERNRVHAIVIDLLEVKNGPKESGHSEDHTPQPQALPPGISPFDTAHALSEDENGDTPDLAHLSKFDE